MRTPQKFPMKIWLMKKSGTLCLFKKETKARKKGKQYSTASHCSLRRKYPRKLTIY
jgi:hypothetical protein